MKSATLFTALTAGETPPRGLPVRNCGMCGAVAPARPAADVLKKSFTAIDTVRGNHVCWACEWALATRWTRSSIVVTSEGWDKIERRDVWRSVCDPPEPPFVIYLTRTGQKHGLYMTSVAASRDAYRLQCEDTGCMFSRRVDPTWMLAAAELRAAGVAASSIETGDYTQHDYRAAGIDFVRDRESVLVTVRARAVFRILMPLIPAKKDIEQWIDWSRRSSCLAS